MTLPCTVELLIVTVGAICSRFTKRESLDIDEWGNHKYVVIIPAHNEEKHLSKTIESLKQNAGVFDIAVVVDNCTDQTKKIAVSHGTIVIERNDPRLQGKSHALHYANRLLLQEGYTHFIYVDADSVVESNFISTIHQLFSSGYKVVEILNRQWCSEKKIIKRVMNIAMTAFVYLRPLGRSYWGLSAGISNGFALAREVLEAVPMETDSIVEDLDYHHKLVERGFFAYFTDKTSIVSSHPHSKTGYIIQRSRWEGGRFRLMVEKSPVLLKSVLSGKMQLIEPLIELLTLPISYYVIINLVLLIFPFAATRIYSVISLSILLIHVLTAIRLGNGGIRDVLYLFLTPFYMVWKLLIIKNILKKSKNNALWERTDRDPH